MAAINEDCHRRHGCPERELQRTIWLPWTRPVTSAITVMNEPSNGRHGRLERGLYLAPWLPRMRPIMGMTGRYTVWWTIDCSVHRGTPLNYIKILRWRHWTNFARAWLRIHCYENMSYIVDWSALSGRWYILDFIHHYCDALIIIINNNY